MMFSFRFVFCLLSVILITEAEVTVEDGGYSNILVRLKQNIKTSDPKGLLEVIQSSLSEASQILQSAIGLRFSKVTILIPQDWDTSDWNIEMKQYTTEHRLSKPDIVIDGTHDTVFGKLPFTDQYGDCGTTGNQVIVPDYFLQDQNTFRKGQILAREWLKYRYGVFDENGFLGDEIYPLFYTTSINGLNSIVLTGCTNVPVNYTLISKGENSCSINADTARLVATGECSVEPEVNDSEDVISSLMYYQEKFQKMEHICGRGHTHSSNSPNKHNALCRGRSVWDVIQLSSDFREESSTPEGITEFTYVQEKAPRVVLTWEYTNKMRDKGNIVLTAIRRFLYHLPNGSGYAAFPFTDTLLEKNDYSMKELSNWPQDRKIELASDFAKPADGCVVCALQKAVEIFSSDPNQPSLDGSVIIFASSNLEIDEDLIERIRNSSLCLTFLAFHGDIDQTKFDTYLSASPCGRLLDLSAIEDKLEIFKILFKALESTVPGIDTDSVTKTVETFYLPSEPISVKIDNTVQKVTFWILSKKESDYMEFMFNGNEVTKSMAEEISSSEIMALSFYPSEEGILTFKYLYTTDDTLTQVRITSKPGQYITTEVFIHDTTEKNSLQQMPVIVYAKIRYGSYTVQNAEVSAVVKAPTGEHISLTLQDDGTGDPDITKDDGIYSRYFIRFSEKGEYEVTVIARNKGQASTYGKVSHSKGYQPCCGSFVEKGDSQFSLPEFKNEFVTSFQAISGRPETGYKPSRIVDLRIDNITDETVVLKWTAPGAEADSGTVESYEIKCFTSEDLTTQFEKGKLMNTNYITPSPRGVVVKTEVNLNSCEDTGDYYISVRAKAFNKFSDISNVIKVHISDHKTSDPEENTTNESTDTKMSSTNAKIIGIIIGIIVAVIVVVIIIYVTVYFLIIKPKRRKTEKTTANQNGHLPIENTAINPINFIPADTLMKHHKEKRKAKIENKEPPIFKEEDFESTNSYLRDINETETPEYGQIKKQIKNIDSLPPKSPKRTTYV